MGTQLSINRDRAVPVVLIVEDEWLVRDAIVEELQKAGWNVLEASTGESALALLQAAQELDVVVTDIQLAGYFSGWDVADAARAAHPDVPVIYASGNSIEKTRMVPGSVFLQKPCRTIELVETCRRLGHQGRP